jgi:hypothetical protein
MRFATRSRPADGLRALSTTLLVVAAGLGLTTLSITDDSVAQDAAPPDSAAAASAPSEPLSDRQRRREVRRQADAQAKAAKAEASAKAKADGQSKSSQKADANAPNNLVFYVEDPQVVCRNIEVIGSKISRRVCGTHEQWDALKRKGEDDMHQLGRSLNGSTAGAPTGTATPAGIGVPP